MAYLIQTTQSVEDYIDAIAALSESGKQALIAGYVNDLAEHADQFLARYALEHESFLFEYDYALVDGGIIYSFRFIVDGTNMPVGVLQVIYVDYETIPLPT